MKKSHLIQLIIALMIFVLLSITFLMWYTTKNRNIRYEVSMMGSVALAEVEIQKEDQTRAKLSGFSTIESAIDYYFRDDLSRKGHEIIRFEDGKNLLIVSAGNIKNFLNDTPSIYFFLFEEDIEGNYYLLNEWMQGIESLFYDTRGNWQDEDRIARDIVLAYTREKTTASINAGIPLYYGVGMGEIPQELSILGECPDQMLAFEYQEQKYFFWYYRSNHQFGKILKRNIDIHSFTLAEIIDNYNVKIVR